MIGMHIRLILISIFGKNKREKKKKNEKGRGIKNAIKMGPPIFILSCVY